MQHLRRRCSQMGSCGGAQENAAHPDRTHTEKIFANTFMLFLFVEMLESQKPTAQSVHLKRVHPASTWPRHEHAVFIGAAVHIVERVDVSLVGSSVERKHRIEVL